MKVFWRFRRLPSSVGSKNSTSLPPRKRVSARRGPMLHIWSRAPDGFATAITARNRRRSLSSLFLQLAHHAADQVFGVGYRFRDQLNVHGRLTRLAGALAIDTVLPHEHECIGEYIQRYGETSSRQTHHELVFFQLIAPLLINTHVLYSNDMGTPSWPVSGARERELLDEVLKSDRWGGYHPFVARFEREFAAFQQCRFGLSACNGTVTLEMALEALGIGEGDEVIVPAISFISSATAVSRMRATPVFVDIEPDTFNIDPEGIRTAIGPKTRAIMPVHFGGPMADMPRTRTGRSGMACAQAASEPSVHSVFRMAK
jgi:DegT/DnrJ/EryC1/StrS aminotransferase family